MNLYNKLKRQSERVLPIGDKLVLRGLRFHGFHGVHPEENKLGQKFVVDVDAWLDLHKAGQTDNLVDTISEQMGERVLPIGDKLVLRGLRFHGFHGVHPEENKLGQKFVVDVDAWLDLRIAGQTDNLVDTISYTEIYRLVKEIVEGPPQNLLESVAHRIASSALSKYPQVSAVRVEVKKPNVAVHSTIDYLGVEILRYQSHEE
ncbi:hypothetical protein Taro_016232 [Colocasia esculenta]|uniref:7,8-dihydroneopterin aldolase n=1 Tax=Colocasia esculenta TaxID=4460 RepID=A0A843UN01_COLES|nr:hypothetical protein [Colocasia esculenta]